MILFRLLGIGLVYGFGFAVIKSLFPTPIILLALTESSGSEGDPLTLTLVYMGVGLLAGLIAAPIFGGVLLMLRGDGGRGAFTGLRLTLSLILAGLMGVISGLLILGVYATGILPSGGVLDPLKIINASNFSPGTPLLVAWTIARDLLPAGLAGLFLSPVGGGLLLRLYGTDRAPVQKVYDEDF